ncbi:MAG: hypothetical protein HKP43_08465 [Altererythrobacter sp.]|nr:hypothetical protein [Altererythrobacter sp.]MBT8431356.1 hypothetical protein [Altererythrobacter sp.]NNE50638.1 hypothetical protein [Altererythrobacter sp.]NNF93936.1 hypothetical protein [Altererythrobacter sp.]NNK46638.1 hypothetical protein [Altererythrobacter sp.]
MPSMLAYLAPLALLLPIGVSDGVNVGDKENSAKLDPREVEIMSGPSSKLETAANSFTGLSPSVAYQVRIERRVTVRISPRRGAPRQNLTADLEELPQPIRYEEGENTECVSINSIAGVQTGSGDRLVLYLRDRRMISARLEKSCRARDFYSGFYVERGDDGNICINRDKLQSRAGAKCELNRMRELTPIYN